MLLLWHLAASALLLHPPLLLLLRCSSAESAFVLVVRVWLRASRLLVVRLRAAVAALRWIPLSAHGCNRLLLYGAFSAFIAAHLNTLAQSGLQHLPGCVA
jgi:hypothetical protein